MEVGRVEEIDAANDIGDTLKRVIGHHGEVIACAYILPHEYGIAQIPGPSDLCSVIGVVPGQFRSCFIDRAVQIEAKAMVFSCGNTRGALLVGKSPTGPRINRAFASMGGISGSIGLTEDVVPATEAGVEEMPLLKTSCDLLVFRSVFALDADRLLPLQSKPGEILEDSLRVFGGATGRIDVLDAKEETPRVFFGKRKGSQCGVGMSLVKLSGGAGGEAGYDTGFSHGTEIWNGLLFLPIYLASVSYPD